jgi:hypothetical protein
MTSAPEPSFAAAVATAKKKCGSMRLTNEELLLLACDEISRTTTWEERSYATGGSCPP